MIRTPRANPLVCQWHYDDVCRSQFRYRRYCNLRTRTLLYGHRVFPPLEFACNKAVSLSFPSLVRQPRPSDTRGPPRNVTRPHPICECPRNPRASMQWSRPSIYESNACRSMVYDRATPLRQASSYPALIQYLALTSTTDRTRPSPKRMRLMLKYRRIPNGLHGPSSYQPGKSSPEFYFLTINRLF